MAADKVQIHVRRYKRRLKNHHSMPQLDVVLEMANEFTLEPETDDCDASSNGTLEVQPLIIAENRTSKPNVSVRDAAMLMDLANANAFNVRNSKNDALEVVYRRSDGNVGWISPSSSAN